MTPTNEQETVIAFFRGDDECLLDTSDTTMKTRMRNQGYTPYAEDEDYSRFKVPTRCVTIRKPKRRTVKLTEEQKEKRRAALAKARAARKQGNGS